MRAFAAFLFLTIFWHAGYCQSPSSDGTGMLGIADTSLWALATNPAQYVGKPAGMVAGVRNSFFYGSLTAYQAGVSVPLYKQTLSVSLQYHGVPYWSDKLGTLSMGTRLFRRLSVAAALQCQHISHSEIASADLYLYPTLYATVLVIPNLSVSATANLQASLYRTHSPYTAPPGCFGGRYLFNPAFSMLYEVYYDQLWHLQNRFGAAYALCNSAELRFGVGSGAEPIAAGLGVNRGLAGFDIAARYNRFLGISFSAGVRVLF